MQLLVKRGYGLCASGVIKAQHAQRTTFPHDPLHDPLPISEHASFLRGGHDTCFPNKNTLLQQSIPKPER